MPNDEPMDDLDDDQYVPEGGITIGDIYIPPPPAPACTFDATGPRYIRSTILTTGIYIMQYFGKWVNWGIKKGVRGKK